jgi:HEAT repeat protein
VTLAGRPWADVRQELFGEPYMVWHDGPDFTLLREAWQREPEQLLEQLFQGMSEGDALAAQSLSELDPAPTGDAAQRVAETLEQHVDTAPANARVQIGLTLYKLTGDPTWTKPIIEVLNGDVHWSSAIDAAIALRQVRPAPELKTALLTAVQSNDYLVRYHSATTLRRWAGVSTDLENDDILFSQLVRDDDPAAWKQVAIALDRL